MVSVLLCTIDRYDITTQCVGPSLACCGEEYELLCVDNGSSDRRVVDYIQTLKPVYHSLNKVNEGYAKMMNQMLLRAEGEFLCVIDNDILLPEDWLMYLVRANKAIPESGVSGIHCLGEIPLTEVRNGVSICPLQHPLGIKFFSRRLLNRIGYFDEEFNPYGHEDIAYHLRAQCAGCINYYVRLGAKHMGEVGSVSPEYDEMKRASAERGHALLQMRAGKAYNGQVYTPAPQLK